MTRGGRTKDRTGTERRCLATGNSQDTATMVRFVAGPDGTVVPDILGKLPGRGMWVTATPAALGLAVKKKVFARAAKQAVTLPDDLLETVESGVAQRLVDLVSLARKAGGAVAGFEKVKGWLANERVRVLLQASDGSERGKSKLWTPEGARYFSCLTQSELGLAFGRETVIHAALTAGGLAERVVEEATRLRSIRDVDGGSSAGKEPTDV